MQQKIYINRKLPTAYILMMILPMAIMTSASIYAFEWLQKSFLSSSIFTLKGISVNGNKRVSTADIIKASGLNVGNDKLFSFMLHVVEKRIKAQSRYLQQVKVTRNLADGWIDIIVKEREPIAFVAVLKDADSFMVVDASGYILETAKANFALLSYGKMPIIVGVNLEVLIKEQKGDTAGKFGVLDLVLKVLRYSRSIMPELFEDITDIDARDPDNITLHLQKRLAIRLASDRIEEGLSNARFWIMDTRYWILNPGIQSIDVRFPGAIYCS